MSTKLVEINYRNNILRGILSFKESFDRLVIMVSGFERKASTEKKFKLLADELVKKNIASLRFDYGGLGLSDGDFSSITVSNLASELREVNKYCKKNLGAKKIYVIAHSLSGCVVAKTIPGNNYKRIVLIAPALNQKDLLKYFFVINNNKDKEINWSNYKNYFKESVFDEIKGRGMITKENYIQPDYVLENLNRDYSPVFTDLENILLIHSDNDKKVPLESINVQIKNKIIVKNGDHDLERPDMIKQWLDKTVEFISN